MEFRILGTLDVVDDGRSIALDSGKQRSLLAVLLIHANSVVSVDRIIDDLWGDDPPASGANTVRHHMSKLRSALETFAAGSDVIRTRPPGYELKVSPESVDWLRFKALADEGRALLDSDPAAAGSTLEDALALWRGDALADFRYEEFAAEPARQMTERRLEAIADRMEAQLRQGHGADLTGELEGLVAEHPYRERFTALLMRSLYRAGRQTDALAAYSALRRRLVENMGLDPTAEIRSLEQQILEQDPALDVVQRAEPASFAKVVRGYELRERIGEGRYGVVYRAVQPAVGREVAVKVLRRELLDDEELVERFEMEAQLVARLEHPHVVPLHDYWRDSTGVYLVMRWLRGGSLADALRHGAWRPGNVLGMVRQVGAALGLAHRQGVVHRDVKPGNVLLDEAGECYLTDFGIAKFLDAASTITRGSSPMTAEYAAPEQLRDEAPVPATDIYQLALVSYEALSGRHPYHGRDVTSRLRAQLDGPIPTLEHVDPALAARVDAVLQRATDPDPKQRQRMMAEFVEDMQVALTAP